MSDDRTIRIGPEEPPRRPAPSRTVLATVGALALAAVVLVFFAVRGGGDDEEAAAPLASEPTEAATVAPQETEPDVVATETEAAATEGATTEPTATPSGPMPTTGDVTAFVDSYEARHGTAVTTRIVDTDADGFDEVVAARVGDNATQIDVAAWDGTEYTVVYSDTGGAAERLDDMAVREVNEQPGLEIITFQSVGEEGRSVSLWGAVPGDDGTRYLRHEAVGGCWDGSNTYGIVGATVDVGQITATCDGSPLPPELWPSDVYVWTDGAWAYERTEERQ